MERRSPIGRFAPILLVLLLSWWAAGPVPAGGQDGGGEELSAETRSTSEDTTAQADASDDASSESGIDSEESLELPEDLLEEPVLDEPPLELLLFDEEDLVAGASRKVSKLSEAPGTITLVQADELDELGILTLADLLRYLESTVLVPGTVDAGVEFRGVQQPFNNKILLLRDGRVLNSPYRGDFSIDLAQPLDHIERVEVVRGPGSALYGANAFAGFINLVTRKGSDLDGVRSRTALGRDGLWYQNVLAGGESSGIDWILSARVAGSDPRDPVNPDRGNDEHRDQMVQGRVSGDTWFVDLGYMEVEAGSPGTFRFPTSKDTYEIRQLTLDGRKSWKLGDKLKLGVRSYYSDADNTYRFVSLNLPECEDGRLYCDVADDAFNNLFDLVDIDGNRLPRDIRLKYEIALNTPPMLRAKEGLDPDVYIDPDTYAAWRDGTLGDRVDTQTSRERRALTELQFDWEVSKSNYLLAGGGMQADILRNSDVGDHTFRDAYLFVEDEQRFFGDRLIASGSVRFDSHSYFGDTASPRLSLIWLPKLGTAAERLVSSRRPFWLKAGYGKAFRSPNFVELFGRTRVGPESRLFGRNDPGVAFLTGNPDLEQESIETLELQAHWEPSRTFETTLTVFDYEIDDEVILNVDRDVVFVLRPVTSIPVPGLRELMFDEELADVPTSARFINVEQGTRGEGMELSFRWAPRKRAEGLVLWGNYSRMQIDRPIEEGLVFVFNETSGVLTDTFQEVRREAGLIDGLNLGLLVRRDKWFAHYRARVTGRLGDSIFSEGARTAHDITLGIDRGPFTARLTGLNVTGTDWLRNPTDGSTPDLKARWHVILGWKWEF